VIREVARVPLFPQRVLDLLRDLTDTTHSLLESQSHQRRTLDTVATEIRQVRSNAEQIPDVKGVLEAIRADVLRIEDRLQRLEREVRALSSQVDAVAPDKKNEGPLAKARDAIAGH
jgi:DNA repair exonuclease SbcCD ATPase subunit